MVTRPLPATGWDCDRVAERRIEIYESSSKYTLVGAVYTCRQHQDSGNKYLLSIDATSWRSERPLAKHGPACGHIIDLLIGNAAITTRTNTGQ